MITIINNIQKLIENDSLDINRFENIHVENIINKIESELKNVITKTEVKLYINRDENKKIQFGINTADTEITKLIQDVISRCQ